MKAIRPYAIHDKLLLSELLDRYLQAIQEPPLQVPLRTLSYDTGIPETVFRRLAELHFHPEDAENITANDFHILFANILFRFPTVKLFQLASGNVLVVR